MSECHDYSGTVFVNIVNGIGIVAEAVLELHHGGVVVQDGGIDHGGGFEAFEVLGRKEAVVPKVGIGAANQVAQTVALFAGEAVFALVLGFGGEVLQPNFEVIAVLHRAEAVEHLGDNLVFGRLLAVCNLFVADSR